jgi:hypothetical protein
LQNIITIPTGALILLLIMPDSVMAIQPHGDPEGIVIHQFSHIFFIFSMGILIYWLRSRELSMAPGWKEIKYAAFFLILWSAGAFVAHLLDEQLQWVTASRIDFWTRHLGSTTGGDALTWIYYIVKLDHLLCVPGFFFLYRGVARLSAIQDEENGTT